MTQLAQKLAKVIAGVFDIVRYQNAQKIPVSGKCFHEGGWAVETISISLCDYGSSLPRKPRCILTNPKLKFINKVATHEPKFFGLIAKSQPEANS